MIISKNKGLQSLFCLFLLFIISLNTLAAKQITIMLYGDSLMAGYGLNQNENLSSALTAKFNLKETLKSKRKFIFSIDCKIQP